MPPLTCASFLARRTCSDAAKRKKNVIGIKTRWHDRVEVDKHDGSTAHCTALYASVQRSVVCIQLLRRLHAAAAVLRCVKEWNGERDGEMEGKRMRQTREQRWLMICTYHLVTRTNWQTPIYNASVFFKTVNVMAVTYLCHTSPSKLRNPSHARQMLRHWDGSLDGAARWRHPNTGRPTSLPSEAVSQACKVKDVDIYRTL